MAERSAAQRRGLTSVWWWEIEPSFMSRVEDGTLHLLDPGPPVRTIWLDVWSRDDTRPIDDWVTDIAAEATAAHPQAVARYVEDGADRDERRFGAWYDEIVDGRHQWGLYAYTVRSDSFVQVALICDDPTDQDWALATWRSLRWAPAN